MRLATSTNLISSRPDGTRFPLEASIRRCAAIGYRVMDVDFNSGRREDSYILRGPDWRERILGLSETARGCGVQLSQSHLPFFNVADPACPDRDYYEEMVRRSVVASGMLGVRWAAVHAGTALDENRSIAVSRKRNLDYFLPLADLAAKHGLGIAIENMQEYLAEGRLKSRRRYTAGVEELCDLIDSFHTPHVAAVWDFGHAHITGQDQAKSLRAVGRRLKATHVHDNNGLYDDHTLPYLGTVDWPGAMRALREVGYEGDFTYEAAYYTRAIPDALLDEAVSFSLKVGRHLLSLAEAS